MYFQKKYKNNSKQKTFEILFKQSLKSVFTKSTRAQKQSKSSLQRLAQAVTSIFSLLIFRSNNNQTSLQFSQSVGFPYRIESEITLHNPSALSDVHNHSTCKTSNY